MTNLESFRFMFDLECLDSKKLPSAAGGCTLCYGGPITDDGVESLDDAFAHAVGRLQYMQGSRNVRSVRFIRISAQELGGPDRRVINVRSEIHPKLAALDGQIQLGLFT